MKELVVTLAVFPLIGAATASLLRVPLPPSRLAQLAFVFLLGAGTNGSILFLAGTLGVPLWFFAIPVASIIAFALRRRSFDTLSAAPAGRHVAATVVFALPLVVLLFAAAVIPARDYDGRVTWLPKARAIAIDGAIDGPFFQGERGLNLHNHYPLLVPLNAATVMKLSGDTRNETARWLYALTAVAALIVLQRMLAMWFGALGAWTAAAAAWLPILTSIEGGALAAYNDLTLTAFFGVALLYVIASGDDPQALRAVGLFAAFAVLAKNEGLALAIAIVIAAGVARRLKWTILAPIVAAIAILSWWKTQVPAAYDEQYGVLIRTLPASLHRIGSAMRALASHAVDFSEWGVFWIAVALAIVIGAFRERSARFAALLVALLAPLGAYVLALTVTSWSIDELANVAANRLLLQLIVPGACVIAMATSLVRRDSSAAR